MPIGIPELLIILVVVLVIFGPKRLPMLGRQLGGGLREFKDSVTGKSGAGDDADDRAALPDADDEGASPASSTASRDETVTRPGR